MCSQVSKKTVKKTHKLYVYIEYVMYKKTIINYTKRNVKKKLKRDVSR